MGIRIDGRLRGKCRSKPEVGIPPFFRDPTGFPVWTPTGFPVQIYSRITDKKWSAGDAGLFLSQLMGKTRTEANRAWKQVVPSALK